MSATFSKLGPWSVEASVGGFGPHIEELHAFFKTRGVTFGSPEDLKPFVDRLDSDAGFRDETSSMVRTIIYRERDGLSWAELMELVAAAVGGPGLDDAGTPEVREALRRLLMFVEGVFRTRRNPGAASSSGAAQVAAPEPERQEHKQPDVPEVAAAEETIPAAAAAESVPAEHPRMDMFYRARVAAHEDSEPVAEERKAADVEKREAEDAVESETVLQPDLRWQVPFEDFEYKEKTERGSPAWLWVAGICALLLAFSAGLIVHQRLIVPLRDPGQPYEAPPPQAAQPQANVPAPGTPTANTTKPTAAESMADMGRVRPTSVAAAAPGVDGGDPNLQSKYMAPARIGASPALMAARLEYAPPPAYPMMAEMTRTQGKVMVEAVVGRSGRVIRAQAISGHHLLRGAAVREVYERRYRPYTLNNRPVDVATIVTVDFKLRQREPLP